jgi:hypothetical protein
VLALRRTRNKKDTLQLTHNYSHNKTTTPRLGLKNSFLHRNQVCSESPVAPTAIMSDGDDTSMLKSNFMRVMRDGCIGAFIAMGKE